MLRAEPGSRSIEDPVDAEGVGDTGLAASYMVDLALKLEFE